MGRRPGVGESGDRPGDLSRTLRTRERVRDVPFRFFAGRLLAAGRIYFFTSPGELPLTPALSPRGEREKFLVLFRLSSAVSILVLILLLFPVLSIPPPCRDIHGRAGPHGRPSRLSSPDRLSCPSLDRNSLRGRGRRPRCRRDGVLRLPGSREARSADRRVLGSIDRACPGGPAGPRDRNARWKPAGDRRGADPARSSGLRLRGGGDQRDSPGRSAGSERSPGGPKGASPRPDRWKQRSRRSPAGRPDVPVSPCTTSFGTSRT